MFQVRQEEFSLIGGNNMKLLPNGLGTQKESLHSR